MAMAARSQPGIARARRSWRAMVKPRPVSRNWKCHADHRQADHAVNRNRFQVAASEGHIKAPVEIPHLRRLWIEGGDRSR